MSVGGAVAVAVLGLVVPASAAGAAAPKFRPGAPGLGDPYFPLEGNSGYDALHYGLDLSYDPATHHLAGTAHITARATQDLSRFDLDFKDMRVHKVTVGGKAASYVRRGQELVITPRSGLRKGTRFEVAVTYAGTPKTIVGSPIVFGAPYGWIYTKDGAFVGCEPNAASTWYPSNDHPSDKAAFTYRITVPKGRAAIANGDLVSQHSSGGSTTYVWDEKAPMATYLATVDIGRYAIHSGRTPGGIPETVAVDPALAKRAKGTFALTARVTDFWSKEFGGYPFGSTGAIVDNVPDIGFSLETQTRPLYGFAPDQGTVSHELAHQWFGDSVSVATWQHIWLNEGFATYASWLWSEHVGQGCVQQIFDSIYKQIPAKSAFWDQSIADPKRDSMFSGAVYTRGGMTLAALQHKIGDPAFFRLLRTWTAQHRHGNATTAQFTRLAEQVSGRDLSHFFHVWLWQQSKPKSW